MLLQPLQRGVGISPLGSGCVGIHKEHLSVSSSSRSPQYVTQITPASESPDLAPGFVTGFCDEHLS